MNELFWVLKQQDSGPNTVLRRFFLSEALQLNTWKFKDF